MAGLHSSCAWRSATSKREPRSASARRSGRLDNTALSTAKAELDAAGLRLTSCRVTTDVVIAAGDLAEVEGLRGYDAVHLAAVIAAKVTVVATVDNELLEAARRRRFDVANPLQPPDAANDARP